MIAGCDTYFYQNLKDERLAGFGAANTEVIESCSARFMPHTCAQSVGKLLFDFFHFYGYSFLYAQRVVSARTGRLLTREDKGWVKQVDRAKKSNYYFCIGEERAECCCVGF